ncbi:unnamed protein product [Lymnaea stagnalis]|uniref:Uncharacterized protein n=1 Tax=Lymnaea stagnalis TaxID=6523 RepID=A0AAV2HDQ5_LYMST
MSRKTDATGSQSLSSGSSEPVKSHRTTIQSGRIAMVAMDSTTAPLTDEAMSSNYHTAFTTGSEMTYPCGTEVEDNVDGRSDTVESATTKCIKEVMRQRKMMRRIPLITLGTTTTFVAFIIVVAFIWSARHTAATA